MDIRICLDAEAPVEVFQGIADLVSQYPGDNPVFVRINTPEGHRTFDLGVGVDYCVEFYLAIHDLLEAA